jgi:hypothetical protein
MPQKLQMHQNNQNHRTTEKMKNSRPHVPHVPQVQPRPDALREVEGSAVEPHHQERIKKGRSNPADTKIRSNWLKLCRVRKLIYEVTGLLTSTSLLLFVTPDAGSVMVNVVPSPGSLSTVISPLCRVMIP